MERIIEWIEPEMVWFVIGIVLIVLELASPGLIIFFFGLGAWIVAISCLLVDISLNTQLLIFLLSSIIMLILLRKRFNIIFKGKVSSLSNDDLDSWTGEKAFVIEEIKPNRIGRVEFHGSNWNAEAEDYIPTGTTVIIVGKNNITLKVKSV